MTDINNSQNEVQAEVDNNVQNEVKEVNEQKKKYKTFKEYYADPKYREKHLKYISEKIPCECGRSVKRFGMSKHKKTTIHSRAMNSKQRPTTPEPKNDMLEEMLKRIIDNKLSTLLTELDQPVLTRQIGYIKNKIKNT